MQPECYYSTVNRQIYYAEHERTLDFAQQTSCRAIQLNISENVKSALRKQSGEQTYRVWFSKCFAAVNNKNVIMTIKNLPVALK